MEILEIAIVGVILSLAIEGIKKVVGTKPWATKVLTVALALVVSAVYYYFSLQAYWPTVLVVLGTASAFYAFFLKNGS